MSISLVVLLIGVFLLFAIKIIENVSFYKTINVNKLTEGDWLVNNIIKNGKQDQTIAACMKRKRT